MKLLRIAIILGSTRPGRNGEAVAKWVYEIAQKRNDAEFELVDIKDSEFVLHYHAERNHQGLGNKIIWPEFAEFPDGGAIRSRQRLGGLLRYYYREAA